MAAETDTTEAEVGEDPALAAGPSLDGRAEPQPSGRLDLGTRAVTLAAIRPARRGDVAGIADVVAGGCQP